jgi:uncharacterized membrane protein YeaQ/YmgE (transglycosylase-associated protein family)
MISLLLLLIVASICGSIGQALAGGEKSGCLTSIALGFIGALLGMWIAKAFDLPLLFRINVGGESFPVIWSIIGSALFIAFLNLFRRRK